jgi:hypothetical protein
MTPAAVKQLTAAGRTANTNHRILQVFSATELTTAASGQRSLNKENLKFITWGVECHSVLARARH